MKSNSPRMCVNSDGWPSLERGCGQFFATLDSLCDVSKTLLYDEISPLEVSLIPVAETEALLPAERDGKKHELH